MNKDSIYPYIDLYDSKEQQVFDAIRFTGYNRKSIENFIRQRSSKWFIEFFTRNKVMLKKDDYNCRPFAPEPKIVFLVFIKMGNFEGHRFRFCDHSKIENSTYLTATP